MSSEMLDAVIASAQINVQPKSAAAQEMCIKELVDRRTELAAGISAMFAAGNTAVTGYPEAMIHSTIMRGIQDAAKNEYDATKALTEAVFNQRYSTIQKGSIVVPCGPLVGTFKHYSGRPTYEYPAHIVEMENELKKAKAAARKAGTAKQLENSSSSFSISVSQAVNA